MTNLGEIFRRWRGHRLWTGQRPHHLRIRSGFYRLRRHPQHDAKPKNLPGDGPGSPEWLSNYWVDRFWGCSHPRRRQIPGLIFLIKVQEGEKVVPGQELCILEAMKMKNVIRAPRAGRIAAVKVNNGQQVAEGDVLVEFLNSD